MANHLGDEELIATEEKVSAYLWYQSKGIKESQAEGQRDLLHARTGAKCEVDRFRLLIPR